MPSTPWERYVCNRLNGIDSALPLFNFIRPFHPWGLRPRFVLLSSWRCSWVFAAAQTVRVSRKTNYHLLWAIWIDMRSGDLCNFIFVACCFPWRVGWNEQNGSPGRSPCHLNCREVIINLGWVTIHHSPFTTIYITAPCPCHSLVTLRPLVQQYAVNSLILTRCFFQGLIILLAFSWVACRPSRFSRLARL